MGLEAVVRDLGYDEIQELRRLVDQRADEHLANWGRWRRGNDGPDGYNQCSAGFVGGGYSKDSEDIREDSESGNAEICDAVIGDMLLNHRIAIQHVYECAVWQFRRLAISDLIIEATTDFWERARLKGLM